MSCTYHTVYWSSCGCVQNIPCTGRRPTCNKVFATTIECRTEKCILCANGIDTTERRRKASIFPARDGLKLRSSEDETKHWEEKAKQNREEEVKASEDEDPKFFLTPEEFGKAMDAEEANPKIRKW